MNEFLPARAQRLHCYEWAGLAGVVLASFMPEVYIIETYNHAVNFDSQNTWDFFANALFETIVTLNSLSLLQFQSGKNCLYKQKELKSFILRKC